MPLRSDTIDFLRRMPKAELHCHLLGTIRHATFIDLVRDAQAPIAPDEIDGYYRRGEKPVGAIVVLRALERHVLRTPDALARITREYLEDASSHGVRYAEIFWNPTGLAHQGGIAYRTGLDAIIRAAREAETDHRIVARLIPSIDREAGPDAAVEMMDWVLDDRRPEVVGIGIDYREPQYPPALFWKAYRMARAAGLRTTAHAGEFGMPWTNVETAIDLLGVDRVDHGYTVLDNPDLTRRCADRGIVFTVVPTNTHYLRTLPAERWATEHPIRHMPGQGIRVHPNTDDPTLHNVTPTRAWRMMMEDFGFDLNDLRHFMLNGLHGAWIDDTTRSEWTQSWTAEFDTLRAGLAA